MADLNRQEVVVTDIRMGFGSMVVFMVKWVIASIPALIILGVIGSLVVGAASALFLGSTSTALVGGTDRESQSVRVARAMMKSDLRNAQSTEEVYWGQHGEYAGGLASLNLSISEGVALDFREASERGFLIEASHPDVDFRCVVWSGEIQATPSVQANPGVVTCGEDR